MRIRPAQPPSRPAIARRAIARRLLAIPLLAATLAMAAAVLPASAASAQVSHAAAPASSSSLWVDYDFLLGASTTFFLPNTPPPGSDNFSCQPSATHPYPVVLVNGTFANMDDNWQAAAPLLYNHGYCVFAFNYGGSYASNPVQGTGEIAASAQQLAAFVSKVLAATGAAKVDLVGHSQGGMMPRYYINFLGGSAVVDKLVALAPSNYGTTLNGLVTLANTFDTLAGINGLVSPTCQACVEQETGSAFLAKLNATPTVAAVRYTVIESTGDEVVTPYTNAFLPAAPNVTNITVNSQCSADHTDHVEIAADPIALADVLNALDPAAPVTVPCLTVLPLTGPVGPVPSF